MRTIYTPWQKLRVVLIKLGCGVDVKCRSTPLQGGGVYCDRMGVDCDIRHTPFCAQAKVLLISKSYKYISSSRDIGK